MEELRDLKLSELREKYPDLRATSKKKFLEQVEELYFKENVSTKDKDELTYEECISHVWDNRLGIDKTLFIAKHRREADQLFYNIFFEVEEKAQKAGITLMVNESMRTIHLNGSYFMRVTRERYQGAAKSMHRFTEFKTLISE